MKTQSSELHRAAEQAIRNEDRLQQWREHYTLATGREPLRVLNPPTTPAHRAALALAQAAAISNANIVKMATYRHQHINNGLPTGPDKNRL